MRHRATTSPSRLPVKSARSKTRQRQGGSRRTELSGDDRRIRPTALSLGFRTDYRIWLLAVTALVLTSLLSGSYPALLLSRFSPLLLLKSVRFSNRRDLSLRKSLVVFQFAISVVMMVATIVLYRQVRYANN